MWRRQCLRLHRHRHHLHQTHGECEACGWFAGGDVWLNVGGWGVTRQETAKCSISRHAQRSTHTRQHTPHTHPQAGLVRMIGLEVCMCLHPKGHTNTNPVCLPTCCSFPADGATSPYAGHNRTQATKCTTQAHNMSIGATDLIAGRMWRPMQRQLLDTNTQPQCHPPTSNRTPSAAPAPDVQTTYPVRPGPAVACEAHASISHPGKGVASCPPKRVWTASGSNSQLDRRSHPLSSLNLLLLPKRHKRSLS